MSRPHCILLGREVRAALLRVRTGTECPEGNLRELTWDTKPDCGIATTRKAQPKTPPGLLTEQRTEQSSPPADRTILLRWQAGEGSKSQKGAITAPERHYLPNCKQASLLTKVSWDSRWSTSAWEGALVVHPENRAAGTGEVISRSARTHQTPGHLSCSDLGRAQNAGPTESVPLRTTCVPEPEWLRLGSAYNPGPASDSSWQSNLEPKQCRQGKHTRRERGQAQCLLYFFLLPFEDNGLLSWVPDVLCRHSEVVLWNLLSV